MTEKEKIDEYIVGMARKGMAVLHAMLEAGEPVPESVVYQGLFECGYSARAASAIVEALHCLGYVSRPRPTFIDLTDKGRFQVNGFLTAGAH